MKIESALNHPLALPVFRPLKSDPSRYAPTSRFVEVLEAFKRLVDFYGPSTAFAAEAVVGLDNDDEHRICELRLQLPGGQSINLVPEEKPLVLEEFCNGKSGCTRDLAELFGLRTTPTKYRVEITLDETTFYDNIPAVKPEHELVHLFAGGYAPRIVAETARRGLILFVTKYVPDAVSATFTTLLYQEDDTGFCYDARLFEAKAKTAGGAEVDLMRAVNEAFDAEAARALEGREYEVFEEGFWEQRVLKHDNEPRGGDLAYYATLLAGGLGCGEDSLSFTISLQKGGE